ncbi:MAG: DUF2752 domain-containing protein [Actinomycetota bacterium]
MPCFLTQLIKSRWAHLAALAVVALAFMLPPDRGFGIPLCQFRNSTNLPCLGCGLTRSYIALAHLDPARSAFYHPLGLVLFPATVATAALLVVRETTRARLVEWTEKRGRSLNYFGSALLIFFVTYGVGRIVWTILSGRPSPW